MLKIAEAVHDERGMYGQDSKQQPGDQTGDEVRIVPYRDEFTVAYRCIDSGIAKNIASAAIQAANNNMIGYGQGMPANSYRDRYGMYLEMLKTGDISKINVPVDTDCVQMAICCMIISGINVTPYVSSSGIDAVLTKTGKFKKIVNFAPKDLKIGDIVWRTGHVAVVIEEGFMNFVGKCNKDNVVVYDRPSGYKKYTLKEWPALGIDNMVDVVGEAKGKKWNFWEIIIAGKYRGYVRKLRIDKIK